MEYLAAEVLELAGNAARNNEKTHIIPKHPTAGEIVAIRDKIAGGGEAVRDKTAGEIEAILEAAERVDEFIVEPSVEAVREAAERSRRTRDRIQAALRHSIVYRPRQN